MATVVVELSDILSYLGNRKRPLIEGEAVFKAGHVILCQLENVEQLAVHALVLRTSALSSPPHKLKLKLSGSTEKWTCECSCKGGQGGYCKHVLATLIYINRHEKLEELSCTDKEQSWGKEKEELKTIYKPQRILEFCHTKQKAFQIDWKIKAATKKQQFEILQNTSEESSLFKFVKRAKQHSFRTRRSLTDLDKPSAEDFLTKRLPSSSLTKQIQECTQSSTVGHFSDENYDAQIENILRYSNQSTFTGMLDVIIPIRQCCKDVLNGLKCDAMDVSVKTKKNKEKWMQERQFRVTASRCYSLYTYKGHNWAVKASSYFWPKSFSNRFVKHGRKYEAAAREAYKQINQVTVIETGLIVCEKHPWLACSPDGIVVDSDSNNPEILLEIKCPYSGIHVGAADFIGQCSYLQIENNEVTLKKTHLYYAQIQLSLAILDIIVCHFILYSSSTEELLTLVIARDDDFCNNLLQTLQHNYFTHMIHSICEYQT